jgi:hypothetical protein
MPLPIHVAGNRDRLARRQHGRQVVRACFEKHSENSLTESGHHAFKVRNAAAQESHWRGSCASVAMNRHPHAVVVAGAVVRRAAGIRAQAQTPFENGVRVREFLPRARQRDPSELALVAVVVSELRIFDRQHVSTHQRERKIVRKLAAIADDVPGWYFADDSWQGKSGRCHGNTGMSAEGRRKRGDELLQPAATREMCTASGLLTCFFGAAATRLSLNVFSRRCFRSSRSVISVAGSSARAAH